MEELITSGHNPSDVWGYTPKQMAAFSFISNKRIERLSAKELSIGIAASRGDPKQVKKQVRKWSQE